MKNPDGNRGSFFQSPAQRRKYHTAHQIEEAHYQIQYARALMAEVEPPAESEPKPAGCTALTHDWIVSPHMHACKECKVCGCMAELDMTGETESEPTSNDYQPWLDQ